MNIIERIINYLVSNIVTIPATYKDLGIINVEFIDFSKKG